MYYPTHTPQSFRRQRAPSLHARDASDSLLLGPGGQIVAAEPAKEDPRVTGLLPEDLPHGNDAGDESNPKPQAQGLPGGAKSRINFLQSLFNDVGFGSFYHYFHSIFLSEDLKRVVDDLDVLVKFNINSVVNKFICYIDIQPNSVSELSSSHERGVRVGIAVGAIAGIISIVTIIVWVARVRARSRRETRRNNSTWPWDRDDRRLEAGFGHGFRFRSAWAGMLDEPKQGNIQCPAGVVEKEQVLPFSDSVPLGHSPYPTIQVPGAHGSVPDLAPDFGRRLQITNLVPGDVASVSSAGSSRVTSRTSSLARRGTGSSKRTKQHQHWTPPPVDTTAARPPETGHGLAIFEEGNTVMDVTELPQLPFPGQDLEQPAQPHAQPTVTPAQDGWTSSFRNNFVSAVQSVLWTNPNAPTPEDPYTTRPARSRRQSMSSQHRNGASSLYSKPPSRQNSTSSRQVRYRDLDGNADYTYGANPDDLADRLERAIYAVSEEPGYSLVDDAAVPLPPAAMVKSRDRTVVSGMLTRASSVYSAASSSDRDPFADEHQPYETHTTSALPDIPSVSRTGSDSSFHEAVQRSGTDDSRYTQRSRSKRVSRAKPGGPRPALSRQSTARSECPSMGADMSRSSSSASGAGEGALTENERYAQRMLRERRKRVTAAKVSSVKQSLRQPTVRRGMGSRRGVGAVGRKDRLV
ncbi:hypothetical protein EIP86_006226 [Pleurotus ostreatoroseus]|nr:hypothetical protein EIP86_006226 [Pleurotus ostreatoroseus]